MPRIYGIRKQNGWVVFEDTVVANSWEEAEVLAESLGAELSGEIQEIHQHISPNELIDQYY